MSSNLRLLALGVAVVLVAPAAARATGAANGNTILIDGVGNEAASYDQARAETLGFTTEVVTDAAVWNAKTTDDFKTYRAIALPDNYCNGPSSTALSSRTVWGPAVTGNILLVGGDPELHAGWGSAGAEALVTNGVGFAANEVGKTGLWMALGAGPLEPVASTSSARSPLANGAPTASTSSPSTLPSLASPTSFYPTGAARPTSRISRRSRRLRPARHPARRRRSRDPELADGTSGTPCLLVRGAAVQPVGLNVTTAGPASAERGTDITYTITYGNTGGSNTTPLFCPHLLTHRIADSPRVGDRGGTRR